ncbi:MAG: outer membrane beta-barrel protein [Aquabacterium sp.]
MSTSATRQKFKLQCTLAAALTLVAASAFAQTPKPPMAGVYVGATAGIGASQWSCADFTTCNRAAFSGKAFGGYRMTPGLAAEINYIYFGANERTNDGGQEAATGISVDRQKTRSITLGINWEVELLHHFTNHLRAGWAFSRKENKVTADTGAVTTTTEYNGSPYVGAGLSFRVNENVRLLSSFDYVVDGHDSNYLFSIGASAEF